MKRDPQCIFCRIAAAEIPSSIVFQNESAIAFLDIGPLADGHLLVIPRHHTDKLSELPAEQCSRLMECVPALGKALLGVTGAEGYNLLCNEGVAAGQVVGHVHFHLIPRRSHDGLGYRWNTRPYPPGRAAELLTAFQRTLGEATS